MGTEAALRLSMVGLAMALVVVGFLTQSLKKTVITYVMGMCLIGGILLPDWEFFDRDFSRWFYPVTAEERAAVVARKSQRFRVYPLRLIGYSTIYGIALYKWWKIVSS